MSSFNPDKEPLPLQRMKGGEKVKSFFIAMCELVKIALLGEYYLQTHCTKKELEMWEWTKTVDPITAKLNKNW
jgi:hypothetical protein